MDKQSYTIVIFGVSGDLAQKKICPALTELRKKFSLKIIGIDRKIANICGEVDERIEGNLLDNAVYEKLATLINKKESVLFYCSVPFSLYTDITKFLHANNIFKCDKNSFRRIVFEKPFGSSQKDSTEINTKILKLIKEEQIYRVDHYLARPIVSNIVYTRFTNRIIESIWNGREIKSIAIILSESEGIGDRASYYEQAGVLNDVFQNHLLQLVALVLMRAPDFLQDSSLNKEKKIVLTKIKAEEVILGQYRGYQHEAGVKQGSGTPTFAAVQLKSTDANWLDVPIIVLTGKKLAQKKSLIHITFKDTDCRIVGQCPLPNNSLTITIVPEDGLKLTINTQKFHDPNKVIPIDLTHTSDDFLPYSQQAYTIIIEDIIKGNRSLAVDFEEIDLSWKITDQAESLGEKVYLYEPGSLGPEEAIKLLQKFDLKSELL